MAEVQYCVECSDVQASVHCLGCDDVFCGLCYQWLHKKGKRKEHNHKPLVNNQQSSHQNEENLPQKNNNSNNILLPGERDEIKLEGEGTTKHFMESFEQELQERAKQRASAAQGIEMKNELEERVKFIPMRLLEEERKLLRLIEGAMEISEYTDKVDVSNNDYGFGFMFFYSNREVAPRNKDDIIKRELDEIFSLLMGLYTSDNFKAGQRMIEEKKFKDNERFFQRVFEIGRRFKIMNPDKLRSIYGKMMCVLQDSVAPGTIPFSCYAPIRTVHSILKEKGCLEMLREDYEIVREATTEIDPTQGDVAMQTARKNAARQLIFKKYEEKMTAEEMTLLIASIDDSNSFVNANRTPIDLMIGYLETYFDPKDEEKGSLEIRSGFGGSCLSHSHSTQYKFVLQSLLLWREIQHEMYKLWVMTDNDLLSDSHRYRLYNTGQGLHRVQAAPCVSKTMSSILGRVQSRLGGWVGLSVVHLGDRDVPNALVFIDKYTQVPWILNPIVQTIQNIGALSMKDENVRVLIESQYGGVEHARKVILRDFFRHGFDGSGDDGGSCIDGRLTSAWNWCSLLEKKDFYNLFMICGFEGFNGSYRR